MKIRSSLFTILTVGCLLFSLMPDRSEAQLPRERVETDPVVDDLFWAPVNIGISTVQNVTASNLNTSVSHTFGLIGGGINRFFGLDDGANTRLGLDYGFHNRFSLGIGRMTYNKVVDLRGKYNLLRQTSSGNIPVDLGTKLSMGISTLSGLEFADRLTYFASIMAARNVDRFSMQISPMAAYFNSPAGNNENLLLGVGILTQFRINDRFALSGEYLPVLGDRNTGTTDAMAIALNIDTGGHIFQVFFTTSQWHNEQYIMANNRDRVWEGDFRFGFNIHRVFGL